MDSIRERLRALPGFPDDLPELDPGAAPHQPEVLFMEWLDDAITTGERQPHAMALVTVRPDATPVARTLILKDLDRRGYHFSTHRTSNKGVQLSQNARASMLFFWRETGRQVRVTGSVAELDHETSQADWAARPTYTGAANPEWQAYALDPDEYEFMQAREDRQHTRLGYRRTAKGWSAGTITTPAG